MINTIAEPFWLALVFAICVSVYTLVRAYMKIDKPYNFRIPYLMNNPINLMTLSGLILLLCELKQIIHRSDTYSFLGFDNCDEKNNSNKNNSNENTQTISDLNNFTKPEKKGAILKIIALICLVLSVYTKNKWLSYNKKRGINNTPLINLIMNTLIDPFWLGGLFFLVIQILVIYSDKDYIQFTELKCKKLGVEEIDTGGNEYKFTPLGDKRLTWFPLIGGKSIFFITKLISFATGTQGVSALGTAF